MAEATVVAAVGWVVSPLIRKLADKPPSDFGGDVSTDKLHELKTITLPKIETVIEAAGTIPIGQLEPWLSDLKAAALEAEDVLDEYDYKLLKEKVSPLSSASLFSVAESSKKTASKAKGCLSPLLPKTKLAKSVEKLEKTAARVDEFIEILKLKINPDLAESSTSAASVVANTQEVIATTSTPPLAVVGRDGECDYIVHLLTSSAADAPESSGSSSKVPVIAIQGIGGAGKTTLAQKIYNDSRVVQYFQRNRMWVHVPHKFDPSRVAKEMMESLTGKPTGDMLNLDALLNKLKENLKDRKFLLVLDDVWDEPKGEMQYRWDQLVGALNAVAVRGSRILMTTRMEGVALMLGAKDCISLEELKPEDCLSIIEHYAFNGGFKFADFPEELSEVGKQIANRLKGSPLAARVVASNQLRRKWTVDAWRRILEEDLLNTSTIRDVLLSSFKHLPPHLQRCFSYCSLFSEGEEMEHDELINLWIAEGFVDVPEKNGSRAEDVGSRYCDELEYYSFFQRLPFFLSDYDNSYFIHDLLHDLAEYVSNGICYRIDGDDEPKEIPLTVVHLSITKASLGIHVPSICKLVSLRTLRVYPDSETESADFVKMFEKLKRLRVLDLRYNKGVSELPSSVGHLKHLRYLDLSGIERLPQSFSRLYHLQLLNLPYSGINSLPEGMNSLISLRHLTAGSDLVCSIPEIGKLTSLQRLCEYRISKDRRYGIGQLKNMRELRGSLRIKNLENVKDKAEASEAMLKEKKHLDQLVLEWDDSDNNRDGRSDEEVLEALAPCCCLKELEIRGYKGVGTPSWMLRNRNLCLSNLQSLQLYDCRNWELGAIEPPSYLKKLKIHTSDSLGYPRWMSESQCLSHLDELHLSDCSKWKVLPPLGRLPMLRVLTIRNATGVRRIGPEFYGRDGGNTGFPRLEELFLQGMESCEHLTGGVQAFPSLRVLNIENWPELKQVSYLPHNLRKLFIRRCPKLMEISLFPLLSLGELKIALEVVDIYKCENLRSVVGLGALPSLEQLRISICSRLLLAMTEAATDAAPQQPLLPSSLQTLSLRNCDGVHRLPPGFLLGLASLTELSIWNCAHIRSLGDDLSCLTSLEDLFVWQCPELAEGAPDGRRFPSVKRTLYINDPSMLGLLQEQALASLQRLIINNCPEDITGFTPEQEEMLLRLTSLKELKFKGCKNLRSLPDNLDSLSSLTELHIMSCPKMETLPNRLPTSLETLNTYECHPQLCEQYGDGGPQRYKIRHSPEILDPMDLDLYDLCLYRA